MPSFQTSLNQIYTDIDDAFNFIEIRNIISEVGVDYDNLEATTKEATIREFLLHLVRKNKFASLFPILRSRAPNKKWFYKGFNSTTDIIWIPYVIVAMKQDEYQEYKHIIESQLIETSFDDIELDSDISFKDRYGKIRADWIPGPNPEQSIYEIMEETKKKIETWNQNELNKIIFLDDFTERFFHESFSVKNESWDYINSQTECVFIIDSLSLFHKDLLRDLHISQITRGSIMLFVSPINFHHNPQNQMIENATIDHLKEEIGIDPRHISKSLQATIFEYSFDSIPILQSWITHAVPAILMRKKDDKEQKNIDQMNFIYGENNDGNFHAFFAGAGTSE